MINSYHYAYTVHIGYSDNAGGMDFWAKLSLYPKIMYGFHGDGDSYQGIIISLYPIYHYIQYHYIQYLLYIVGYQYQSDVFIIHGNKSTNFE